MKERTFKSLIMLYQKDIITSNQVISAIIRSEIAPETAATWIELFFINHYAASMKGGEPR